MNTDFGFDWIDYGFRNYDPSIGRWHSVDMLAETYTSESPYNYVKCNPIKYIDPDGLKVIYGGNNPTRKERRQVRRDVRRARRSSSSFNKMFKAAKKEYKKNGKDLHIVKRPGSGKSLTDFEITDHPTGNKGIAQSKPQDWVGYDNIGGGDVSYSAIEYTDTHQFITWGYDSGQRELTTRLPSDLFKRWIPTPRINSNNPFNHAYSSGGILVNNSTATVSYAVIGKFPSAETSVIHSFQAISDVIFYKIVTTRGGLFNMRRRKTYEKISDPGITIVPERREYNNRLLIGHF